ncbi:MAG: hypothetical protein ABWY19_09315, partial [Marmoricola sp.]
AMSAGWTGRAERLLDELAPDGVEAAYVTFLHMYRDLGAGDLEAAAAKAEAVADVDAGTASVTCSCSG